MILTLRIMANFKETETPTLITKLSGTTYEG